MSPSRRPDTYWILDRDQVRCLANAHRQDLVDRLAADGPLSVRELADAVGRKPSALYHHLRRLQDVGLVEEAGSRTVHRRREVLYATPSPRMRLRRALARPEFRDLMRDTVTALTRQMDRDFAEGLDHPGAATDGPRRNLGFFRLLGSPGPRALAEINRLLERVAELLWSPPADDRPLLSFAWTMTPLRHPGRTPSPDRGTDP